MNTQEYNRLIREIIRGEQSGMAKDFDPDKLLQKMHDQYVHNRTDQ